MGTTDITAMEEEASWVAVEVTEEASQVAEEMGAVEEVEEVAAKCDAA